MLGGHARERLRLEPARPTPLLPVKVRVPPVLGDAEAARARAQRGTSLAGELEIVGVHEVLALVDADHDGILKMGSQKAKQVYSTHNNEFADGLRVEVGWMITRGGDGSHLPQVREVSRAHAPRPSCPPLVRLELLELVAHLGTEVRRRARHAHK